MNFSPSDWQRLREMREGFLRGTREDYWKNERDLQLYNAVYAQRIGWKWDAVLAKLDEAGWRPSARHLLDWGCGSGVAARTVAQWAGITRATVLDRSPAATRFAASSLKEVCVEASIVERTPVMDDHTVLLVSHVLGELSEEATANLVQLARQAHEVIWVEPGSFADSKRLGRVREKLLSAGHHIVAPCTHEKRCPMLGADSAQHESGPAQDHAKADPADWCHFFADPPMAIFQSRIWTMIGRELSIDLRSLPYSFLATTKATIASRAGERIIGRPLQGNRHCKLLCCGAAGLVERVVQKRDDAHLFRHLWKKDTGGVYRWTLSAENPHRILAGTQIESTKAIERSDRSAEAD